MDSFASACIVGRHMCQERLVALADREERGRPSQSSTGCQFESGCVSPLVCLLPGRVKSVCFDHSR